MNPFGRKEPSAAARMEPSEQKQGQVKKGLIRLGSIAAAGLLAVGGALGTLGQKVAEVAVPQPVTTPVATPGSRSLLEQVRSILSQMWWLLSSLLSSIAYDAFKDAWRRTRARWSARRRDAADRRSDVPSDALRDTIWESLLQSKGRLSLNQVDRFQRMAEAEGVDAKEFLAFLRELRTDLEQELDKQDSDKQDSVSSLAAAAVAKYPRPPSAAP
jgi:hypothetical protein